MALRIPMALLLIVFTRPVRESRRRAAGSTPGRRPHFGRGGEDREPPRPGPRVAPGDVPAYPDHARDTVMRTLFFEFEHDDWEA
jgi:hypothetical protein